MVEKKDIEHIASIAHLKIDDQDIDTFAKQLGDILNYMEKLDELETDAVVTTAYTVSMRNVLREDKVEPSMERKKVLANAPEQKDGQFKVPKIMGD